MQFVTLVKQKNMKNITLAVCFFLLGIMHIHAQTSQEAAQKAWMDYMTPGKFHQMFAKADGDWTVETTMWMEPGAPPAKSTGSAVNKMILGGRYQESKHTGNMMGMPFEGISILGYDNAKKEFVNTWIDNMGTGIMTMTGKWDESSRTINFTGSSVDPATGKEMKIREVFKLVDDDHQTMEMFMTADGKEFKSMEVKFTRK
jgi:hypothetical protein